MVEELSSKRFRELALECQEEAKRARSQEIREGYMHMAEQWLKLADDHDVVCSHLAATILGLSAGPWSVALSKPLPVSFSVSRYR